MKTSLPGVYMILNKVTNKRYIGSAARPIFSRFAEHRYALRNKAHRNPHLQNSWNKHGEDAFVFIVLENTTPDNALDAEKRWFDNFQQMDCGLYNCKPGGQNSQLGMIHTAASRVKISIGHTGLRYKMSPEGAAVIRALNKLKMTPEIIAKIAKPYKMISPDGEIFDGVNLSALCRKYDLSISAMTNVKNGRLGNHKGWIAYDPNQPVSPFTGKIREWMVTYSVRSPDGVEYQTNNIEAFARERCLDPKGLRKTARGLQSHHKGWRKS